MENWIQVEEFKDYEVSNLGSIRRKQSTPHHPGKTLLKPWLGTGGYLTVQFYENSKAYTRSVHVVVAKAFLPNPKGLPEVNHLGPKSDCRALRLEWSTKRGNTVHAVKTGRTPGDGISFIKKTGRYRARWNPSPCVRESIGVFGTYEEAKAARDLKIATLQEDA